ncbi:MAG: membrane protein insertase YidC [Gammaproteobacteria bacterium 28-57-27]|nr:MAG: membrane protein insertase YidC [Gammaproteobacteria bacterium 28-57-27]
MDSQRLILVVAFSFVLLLMWQAWNEDNAALLKQAQTSAMTANGAPVRNDLPSASNAPQSNAPAADVPTAHASAVPGAPAGTPTDGGQIRLISDVLDLTINTQGGVVQRAELSKYPINLEHPDQPVRLLNDAPGLFNVAQSGLRATSGAAPDHYAVFKADSHEFRLADGQDKLVVPLTWEQDGIRVTKTFTLTRGNYAVDVSQTVTNNSAAPWVGSQYRQLQRGPIDGGMALVYTYTGGVYAGTPANGERLAYQKTPLEELPKKPVDASLKDGWVAMIQHYFLSAWVPSDKEDFNHFYSLTSAQSNGQPLYTLGMMSPAHTIAPGASNEFSSRLYLGPKIQDDLEKVATGLDLTVDYGMLHFIAKPIFWLLSLFYSWIGNWGWAIILVTVVIKLAFYRLSESSYRSMANMRKLQPKLASLKERYGEDKQKFSEEMMKLYRTEKINPLGGCLPMLVQIPVFIALYWVLVESVELRQAPWILWINDLTAKDPYFVLPIIMGISMWLQHKLNPQPMDEMQRKVFQILPPVFTVFFAFFPSGLVLYWVVNNILSIAQQWVINKRMGALDADLEPASASKSATTPVKLTKK